MVNAVRKIKNWEIPEGKKTVLSFVPIKPSLLSVRLKHCLASMKITRLKDVCIPSAWYVSEKSWTDIVLNQPNLGRKAYREFVEYLIEEGLTPVYVDDEDSMTGGLMR